MCDGGGGDGGGGGGGDSGGWDGGGDTYHDNDHHYGHGYHDDDHHHHGTGGSNPVAEWIALLMTGCFSVIASIVGVVTLISSISKNSWFEVTGEIIDIRVCDNNGNSSGTTYGAIISYEVDGTEYTIVGNSCSSFKPTVGNDIRVVYDPEDPSSGVNGTFAGLWLVPIIALGVGVIMCFVCSGLLIKKCRKPPPDPNAGFGGASPPPSHAPPTSTSYDDEKPDPAPPAPPTAMQSYGQSPSTTQNAASSNQYYSNTNTNTYTYTTSTNSTNNNDNGKPSLFDQMNSGM